jgi:hypothetical protein
MTPAEPAYEAAREDVSAGSLEFDETPEGNDANAHDAAYAEPEPEPEAEDDSGSGADDEEPR